MARMKQYIWKPILLLIAGGAVYVWDGIQMNSWVKNLPMMGIYLIIIIALFWTQRKKDLMREKRNDSVTDND